MSNGESDPGTREIPGSSVVEFEEIPHDPIAHKDETARKIAVYLFWAFALVIVAQYVLVALFSCKGNKVDLDSIEKLFSAVLPVVSGFLGAAVTYYFTKDRS